MAGILMVAAETGNINGLYVSIKADPKVLDDIDVIPFVDTPLHTAASAGHTDFAIEILRLKPSFGRKLNPDGLSSLHLALINDKFETVKRLIKFDKELIRIKGREGANPLHYVAEKASDGDQKRMDDPINADQQQRGTDEEQRALPNIEQVRVVAEQGVVDDRINILAEFLFACPNSVEDLTIQDETALHIAVKSKNKKAVAIILGCIRRIGRKRVLDYKDKEGNIVLHMAVSTSQDVIARSLRSARVSSVFVSILRSAGALKSSSPDPSLAEFLNSPERVSEILFKQMFHMNRAVSMELRNIGLVVAVLIATATYQAALSPPGGIGDDALIKALTNGTNINGTVSSTNNLFAANTSSINATSFTPTHEFKLLVIKDELVFLLLYGSNTFAYVLSMLMMMFLLPFKPFGILHVSLFCMMCSYGVLLFLVSTYQLFPVAFSVYGMLIYLMVAIIFNSKGNKRFQMLERLMMNNVEQ